MDLTLSVIKVLSIIASAVFGGLGLLTEYKDKSGKITKWGRVALGGVLISAAISLITQILETSQARKAAEKARAQADQETRTLRDLVDTAHTTADQQRSNLSQTVLLREQMLNASKAVDANLNTSRQMASDISSALVETRRVAKQMDRSLSTQQTLVDAQRRVQNQVLRAYYPLQPLTLKFELAYSMDQPALNAYAKRVLRDIVSYFERNGRVADGLQTILETRTF